MANEHRLHPLARPVSIEVDTDRKGAPVQIRDPGRRGFGRVAAIQESWRIDDEWWRRPVSRLYYRVVLESGRVVTLFQDLTDHRWHLQ